MPGLCSGRHHNKHTDPGPSRTAQKLDPACDTPDLGGRRTVLGAEESSAAGPEQQHDPEPDNQTQTRQ